MILDVQGGDAPPAIAEIKDQYHKAARRWREILKDKQTPKERRSAILRELEAR